MKLKLIEVPNPILKQKSVKVLEINQEIKNFINDMFETMYINNGIGLSAIQVGKPLQIIVIDICKKNEEKHNPLVFINPTITWYSSEKQLMEEGCLSVPDQRAEILRSLEIEVKYNNLNMDQKTLKIDGDLAHCLQHEIDHTNGILYIDYLSKLKRDILINKIKKK